MHFDPSLEEALSLVNSFIENYVDPLLESSTPEGLQQAAPLATRVQDFRSLITAAPELRLRNAIPEPQADCQQASQEIQQASQQASQQIQQASQQASQSIQQASQQASQAAQQASQSASQAIQQFSNSASQSIAAASRSVSSAISSASAAIASAQSSAAQAISQANQSMMSAQASASSVQAGASSAILQAGAAVAAATGSAAAAGSSFLAAAAKATESAQVSVAAISAAAASQVSQASQQVTASQTAAVTATQAALAIVGSIIASTLITILIYFLVIRHKRKARRVSREQRSSPKRNYFADPKFPPSAQNAPTIAASQSNYAPTRNGPISTSPTSFSLFATASGAKSSGPRDSLVKTTTVPWNPSKPPEAPTLKAWLKVQDGVSPFGPINLPTDSKSTAPLGGQLKSPLRSIDATALKSPRLVSKIPVATNSPGFPSYVGNKTTITTVPKSPLTLPTSPKKPDTLPQHSMPGPSYRESKASVWTDDVPYQSPSPPLQSPPKEKKIRGTPAPKSVEKDYGMTIPSPRAPVRTTAEWFAAREAVKSQDFSSEPSAYTSTANIGIGMKDKPWRPSTGLPRNPRSGSGLPRLGQRNVRSIEGDVQGLNRFLAPGDRMSQNSRFGSDRSERSQPTPGVGKAM
ncbi:hypothetical protein L207DRAFT_582707 [Hyaloscypha variabilis F]|uniref:Uncharacterized protein n=1 Tax=Hyaloscypha variabilis (strain UAMH 11265 / GT02V1 / F) TaxID=1149755 RepID=A0A2J6RPS2_HYAVF|nr:hypothetical protein L207DRAFT_582707 [Hyaloscypha variabilis F]